MGSINTSNLGFSKDGKTLYGIRADADKWFLLLRSTSRRAKLRDIKPVDSALRPISPLNPAIFRFTLAPDGKKALRIRFAPSAPAACGCCRGLPANSLEVPIRANHVPDHSKDTLQLRRRVSALSAGRAAGRSAHEHRGFTRATVTFLHTRSSATQLYADLGDKEHAFEWLNAAFQEYDVSIISLRTDFSMDPLRSDPRYIELVRKVGYSDRGTMMLFP